MISGHLLGPCVETREIIINEVGLEMSCLKEIYKEKKGKNKVKPKYLHK